MSVWPQLTGNSNVFRQSYVSGFLDVSGGTVLRNDVSMNGNISVGQTLYTVGGINQTGTSLPVAGIIPNDGTVAGRLFVLNDSSLNGRLFVSGDVSMNQRLFVGGDVSMNGNLYNFGRTIHQGDVSMNSKLFVAGNVGINNSNPFYSLDITGYYRAAMPLVILTCSTHISSATNNHTINWTAASINTGTMWSSGNPSRITAPINVMYSFTFKSHAVTLSTVNYSASFTISQYNSSGTLIVPNNANTASTYVIGTAPSPQSGNGDIHFSGTITCYMNIGDYLIIGESAWPSSITTQWNYNGTWTCAWGYCMMAL